MITITNSQDMQKYLKEGTNSVYEFKSMGMLADVKFKYNLFDTRNKRIHDGGEEGGAVILKAKSIKADHLIVDHIEADKIDVSNLVATFIFGRKIRASQIECMNIEADYLRCEILYATVLAARKVNAEYVDVCELRNCSKMKVRKATLLSTNGGKIKAKQLSLNEKKDASLLPKTRRWYNFFMREEAEKQRKMEAQQLLKEDKQKAKIAKQTRKTKQKSTIAHAKTDSKAVQKNKKQMQKDSVVDALDQQKTKDSK